MNARLAPLFEALESRTMLSAAPLVHHAHHHAVHKHHTPPPAALIASLPTPAAGDPIYMQIAGIPGDVTAAGFENAIQLNSFQWGVTRAIFRNGIGSGVGAGRVSMADVVITKMLDKASPLLLQAIFSGKMIPTVDISFVTNGNADRGPVTYAEYKFSNVLISSYNVSSGGDRPTESLSLNFTKVEFRFIPQNPDGTVGAPVVATFNNAFNRVA